MKRMHLRMTLSAAVWMGGSIVAASAMADHPQGAYGHGPGMMGGYGIGSDMMGGHGLGYGMGSGMMGAYGPGSDLNLTGEQRSKISRIQDEVRRKHWELMGKMQDEQSRMNEQYNSERRDDAELSKSYRKMSDLRHQMFDLSLSAQKQIDSVLTAEQRAKQRRG